MDKCDLSILTHNINMKPARWNQRLIAGSFDMGVFVTKNKRVKQFAVLLKRTLEIDGFVFITRISLSQTRSRL